VSTSAAPLSGALGDVLREFTRGAATTDEIARTTGLHRELVALALDQLVTLGLVTRESMSSGCPDGGCGGCPAPTGHGCGSAVVTPRGGVVTLSLSRRPPTPDVVDRAGTRQG
jgi:hypothetical protein